MKVKKGEKIDYIVKVLRDPVVETKRAKLLHQKLELLNSTLTKVKKRLDFLSLNHFDTQMQNELGHLLNKVFYQGNLTIKVRKEPPKIPLDIQEAMNHNTYGVLIPVKRIRAVYDFKKPDNGTNKKSERLAMERSKQPGGQLGYPKKYPIKLSTKKSNPKKSSQLKRSNSDYKTSHSTTEAASRPTSAA